MTQSFMGLSSSASFYFKKTNHTVNLTVGENGMNRVHVYSVTAHAQLNRMEHGLMFSKTTFY